jgi:hypothetical protein
MIPPIRLLVAACLVGLTVSPVQAARLLEVRIEQDGQTVLTGMTSDSGDNHPYVTWEKLKEVELEPFGTFRKSFRGATQARLKGPVRISILHGGRVIAEGRAQVVVAELRVVRYISASGWRVAAGEMERTRKAAGITPPPPDLWLFVALSLMLVALLALAGWMIRMVTKTRTG